MIFCNPIQFIIGPVWHVWGLFWNWRRKFNNIRHYQRLPLLLCCCFWRHLDWCHLGLHHRVCHQVYKPCKNSWAFVCFYNGISVLSNCWNIQNVRNFGVSFLLRLLYIFATSLMKGTVQYLYIFISHAKALFFSTGLHFVV